MNQEMRASALLASAARLVERALGQLDIEEYDCDKCGRKSFKNNTEARVRESLMALPSRLLSAAEKLEGKSGLRLTMGQDDGGHSAARKDR